MGMPYSGIRSTATFASRYLDTIGDGTGAFEANVDGSITPVDFKYSVPEGKMLLVNRIIVWIRDGGSFDAGLYGNGLALTNGIIAGVETPAGDAVFRPSSSQVPVRTNGDWASLSFDLEFFSQGQGDEIAVARYSYDKDGAPLLIPGGHSFLVRIQDNLTALSGHRFRLGCVMADG